MSADYEENQTRFYGTVQPARCICCGGEILRAVCPRCGFGDCRNPDDDPEIRTENNLWHPHAGRSYWLPSQIGRRLYWAHQLEFGDYN